MDKNTIFLIVLFVGIVVLFVTFWYIKKMPSQSSLKQVDSFTEVISSRGSYEYWNDEKAPIWIFLEETLPISNRGTIRGTNLWSINDLYAYQQICLSSILRQMPLNRIHLLTYKNVSQYLPNYHPLRYATYPIELQIDSIKYNILSKYGGIWLTSWTLLFNDLNRIITHLDDNGCLSIGNYTINDNNKYYNYPDDSCWLAKPGNELMIFLAKKTDITANKMSDFANYDYKNSSKKLINEYQKMTVALDKKSSYIHLDGTFNGSIFSDGSIIPFDFMFTSADFPYYDSSKIYWYQLDYQNVMKRMNYKWFLAIDADQLLHGKYNLSELSRIALGISKWGGKNTPYRISTDPIQCNNISALWEKSTAAAPRAVGKYQGILSDNV